jgi:hypothetical protein
MTMLWWNADAAKLALFNRRAAARLLVRLGPRKFAKISQRRAHEKSALSNGCGLCGKIDNYYAGGMFAIPGTIGSRSFALIPVESRAVR